MLTSGWKNAVNRIIGVIVGLRLCQLPIACSLNFRAWDVDIHNIVVHVYCNSLDIFHNAPWICYAGWRGVQSDFVITQGDYRWLHRPIKRQQVLFGTTFQCTQDWYIWEGSTTYRLVLVWAVSVTARSCELQLL